MSPTRRRRETPEPSGRNHLHRRSSWAGLKRGDPVEVEGTRQRGAAWQFVAHVTNTTTGAEWVEVVGGTRGDRNVRSFPPERIFPPDGLRTGRPSLADAPTLPFG